MKMRKPNDFKGMRLSLCLLFVLVVAATFMVTGTQGRTPDTAPTTRMSMVEDWSHHHMVFSAPANDYQYLQLQREPRYLQQRLARDAAGRQLSAVASPTVSAALPVRPSDRKLKPAKNAMKADWGMSVGVNGGAGTAMYPAKFTFDVNATASCANDYVVFNTSLVGGGAAVKASRTGTFSNNGAAAGQTVTVDGVVLTGSTLSNTGTNWQVGGTTATLAANVAAAINRNLATVTASSGGTATVTVTAVNFGSAANAFTLLEGVTQFTWAGGTLTGGVDATGSIIAFNNLYSTQGSVGGLCAQNGASVMWYYNTNAATGVAVTSPIISILGDKVAFVESRSNANGGSRLHILKWKAGQGSYAAAVTPDLNIASWASCTLGSSCIIDVTFNATQADTNSSPYYDYTNDVIYVGDNNGVLHKFTGVFYGTPAEVTAGGWPITINGGNTLSSPVFITGTKNIVVGDSTGRLSFVREVGSSLGACAAGSPPCLGSVVINLGGSIVDAPLCDGSTGKVHWFDGRVTNNNGVVVQTDSALGNQVTITFANNGSNLDASAPFHTGAFDAAYLASTSPTITGFLYVVARNTANTNRPSLFRIGFNGTGTMNAVVNAGPLVLVNASLNFPEDASPLTEIKNGLVDRLFVSVDNNENLTGCGGDSCLYSFDISGAFPANSSAGFEVGGNGVAGGTSGIIVDNVSASSQASNIYFTLKLNAATGGALCDSVTGVGCAIKLTQSALN